MSSIRQIRRELPALLRLAIPLVLAEIGWMSMNFVDLAMIGHAGAVALAAVSLGSALFYIFAIFCEGMLLGLDALVPQQFGAGKLEECHRTLWASLQFSAPVSVAAAVVVVLSGVLLPRFGIAPEIVVQAKQFLFAMAWGVPPLMFFFALRRYLQGIHRVKIISFALISANLVNLGFNYLLIFGHMGFPAMGARGSGWSTTISRVYLLAVLVIYTLRHSKREGWMLLSYARTFHDQRIRELVRLGAPAAAQIGLEVAVFSASTLLAGRLGAVIVSGHQIALSLASFTFMVPLGISSATAVRVGNAIGRGDIRAASVSGSAGLLVSTGFMSCAAVAFWTIPQTLVGLFTTDPAVMQVGVSLLAIAAVFQFFDGLQVTSIGALRGSGDTRTAMITDLVGWWLIALPVGAFLCFHQGWGARGLWAGLCIGLVLIGVVIGTAWRRRIRRLGVEMTQKRVEELAG